MKWTIRVEVTPDGNPPIIYDIGTIVSPDVVDYEVYRKPLSKHGDISNRELIASNIISVGELVIKDTVYARRFNREALDHFWERLTVHHSIDGAARRGLQHAPVRPRHPGSRWSFGA
jgi:hypothetical protein